MKTSGIVDESGDDEDAEEQGSRPTKFLKKTRRMRRMRRRRGEKRGRNGAGYIYACPRMGMGSITDHPE